jgi:small-conductance mechanosensitive channel
MRTRRPDDDRNESADERLDRNWGELLQELRITQTGLQLLSGFLLTLPFTQTFGSLLSGQKYLYLSLVVTAVVAVALNLTPVILHRRLFGRHLKQRVVEVGHVMSQLVIALVALLFTGTAALIFWVVVDLTAAVVLSIVLVVVLALLLVVLPERLARAPDLTRRT